MEKQVDKEHYRFERYCHFGRWASYWYQLREVLALRPKSVLEIGVGDGVLKNYLVGNRGVEYRNVDVAEDLGPDIVGSVDDLPVPDASFDVAVAFEVLEHLPFERFEKSLAELSRVSRKHVVISLPHFGPPVMLCLKVPFLKEFRFAWKFPFPRRHEFNGEHYWEIGKKGYPPGRIREAMSRHFSIEREFVPFENQYHHFFVLAKRND